MLNTSISEKKNDEVASMPGQINKSTKQWIEWTIYSKPEFVEK